MARKPAPASGTPAAPAAPAAPTMPDRAYLLNIPTFDWNAQMLVPGHLLSQIDALFAEITLVHSLVAVGGAYCLTDKGTARLSVVPAPADAYTLAADSDEAFAKWHNATTKLRGDNNGGKLIATVEAWRADK